MRCGYSEDQNIQTKLDIEEAAKSKTSPAYKNIFDKTKTALRSHQYAKDLNSVNIKNQPKRSLMTLVSEYESTNSLGNEEIGEVEVYFNKKRKQDKPKKKWKCKLCLCKHPLTLDCDCECTKHPYWKCPSVEKEKKRKRDGESSEAKKEQGASSSGAHYYTFMAEMQKASRDNAKI